MTNQEVLEILADARLRGSAANDNNSPDLDPDVIYIEE